MFLSFYRCYVYYIILDIVLSIYCVDCIMKLQKIIEALIKPFADKRIRIYVSSTAFYLILSFIPMSILLFSLMTFLPFESGWSFLLRKILPDEIFYPLFELVNWIKQQHSVQLLSISGIMTIWSASKCMAAIIGGLDHVMQVTHRSHSFGRRLRAICLLLPLPLLLYFLMIFRVIISTLSYSLLQSILPGIAYLVQYFDLYTILLLSIILFIMFRVLPSDTLPFRKCVEGAIITAGLWFISINLFSVYVRYFSSYTVYGIIGSVYLAMLWLYFSIHIIFWGGKLIYLRTNNLYRPLQIIRSFF